MCKIERGGWIRDNLPHPSSDFEIQRTRTCFIYFEKLVSISTIILQELNGEIQWNKSDKRNYFYFHQIIHRSILWSSFNSSSNLVWIGDDWRIIFLSRNELPFYNNSNNFLPRVSIFPMECVLQTTNRERERGNRRKHSIEPLSNSKRIQLGVVRGGWQRCLAPTRRCGAHTNSRCRCMERQPCPVCA